jgi:2-hydroxychromene-2-carboxylate isomerase
MTKIEMFFDCSSPWTYLAFHNIRPLAAEFRAEMVWRPILVGGIFNAINPIYEKPPIPAKQAYFQKDQQDWARLAGLTIIRPSVFPVNSVKAMRGCIALKKEGKLEPFAKGVFEAYWRDNRDISQLSVLTDICRQIGVEPDTFLVAIEKPEVKEALRNNTQEVMDRGGFGSPTLFINGTDMYFGNDRMPLIRAALERLSD